MHWWPMAILFPVSTFAHLILKMTIFKNCTLSELLLLLLFEVTLTVVLNRPGKIHTDWNIVLLSQDWFSKVPRLGGLKQRTWILSQFSRWEVWEQNGMKTIFPSELWRITLLSFSTFWFVARWHQSLLTPSSVCAHLSLNHHITLSLCVCVPISHSHKGVNSTGLIITFQDNLKWLNFKWNHVPV